MVTIDAPSSLESFRRFIMASTCNSFAPRSYLDDPEVFPTREEDKGSIYVEAADEVTLKKIRDIIPDNFLLIPGIGAQGGDVDEVIKSCTTTENKKILINISRSIIYAGNNENFFIEAVKKVNEFNSSINFK